MNRATMNAERRATLHLARPADAPIEIKRFEGESDKHYQDRCAAIRALGVRWLRHPEYRFQQLHSTNAVIWKAAHAQWWQQVHDAAARDRERNPAFQRAQAVRAAMGGA
jgi:hypothetical protein